MFTTGSREKVPGKTCEKRVRNNNNNNNNNTKISMLKQMHVESVYTKSKFLAPVSFFTVQ
jgi:hypothetical protein